MSVTVPKPPHGSLAWLELRHRDQHGRVRFGASEAPTIMGVNPWESITDLAIAKWSPPVVSEPNAAMERGNILEPALIAYAAQLLGEAVTTPDEMFVHERFIATLDGLTGDGRTIVEAKTTTAHSCDDPLPDAYYWQVTAQFACVPEADRAVVVVLDKRMRLGHWTVVRSELDVARLLLRADELGDQLDARRLPFDGVLTEKQTRTLYPDPAGTTELPVTAVAVIDLWQAARAAREEAEAAEQRYRDELAGLLGNAEVGTVDGHPVVSFKGRKGASRVDLRALEQDHPDLVARYRRAGSPTRVLKSLL